MKFNDAFQVGKEDAEAAAGIENLLTNYYR